MGDDSEQIDAALSSVPISNIAPLAVTDEINEVLNNNVQLTNPSSDKTTISRLTVQLKRLNDANTKYKNLLKLAKDRIQKQEEVEELREGKKSLEARLVSDEREVAGQITFDDAPDKLQDTESKIVSVLQRIKVLVGNADYMEEIWALLEMEIERENDAVSGPTIRRYKDWKRFDTETQLQDFIRRDTGEPLTLPPYSLSPEQSAMIQRESESNVARVTEEFRRFRVRAELARKQADSQIRDLQNSNKRNTTQRIAAQDYQNETTNMKTLESQLDQLKAEMIAQKAQFKESYDAVVAENDTLKSTGSDALVASQWRQRYESCLKERDELQSKQNEWQTKNKDDDKYEAKYRDLKGKKINDVAKPPCYHYCSHFSLPMK